MVSSNLTQIYCKATTPPTIGFFGGPFDNNIEHCILYVPVGCKELYANDDAWGYNFKNIQEMDFKSGIEDAIKNDNDISVRVESGTIVVDSDHDVAIDICDIHGLIVYSGAPATINGLGNGLYIVRAAGKSHKVII